MNYPLYVGCDSGMVSVSLERYVELMKPETRLKQLHKEFNEWVDEIINTQEGMKKEMYGLNEPKRSSHYFRMKEKYEIVKNAFNDLYNKEIE